MLEDEAQRQFGQVHPVRHQRLQPFDAVQRVGAVAGVKYMFRQSPSGQCESGVSVPVRLPSSNGTRAMSAMPCSRQYGNSSSSGDWSKML